MKLNAVSMANAIDFKHFIILRLLSDYSLTICFVDTVVPSNTRLTAKLPDDRLESDTSTAAVSTGQ